MEGDILMDLAESVFKIEGMHCAACVRRVEKALSALDWVIEARVDLSAEEAYVRYDDQRGSLEQLFEAVAQAGYRAKAKNQGGLIGDQSRG
jgi:Cu+-exporting ATPase